MDLDHRLQVQNQIQTMRIQSTIILTVISPRLSAHMSAITSQCRNYIYRLTTDVIICFAIDNCFIIFQHILFLSIYCDIELIQSVGFICIRRFIIRALCINRIRIEIHSDTLCFIITVKQCHIEFDLARSGIQVRTCVIPVQIIAKFVILTIFLQRLLCAVRPIIIGIKQAVVTILICSCLIFVYTGNCVLVNIIAVFYTNHIARRIVLVSHIFGCSCVISNIHMSEVTFAILFKMFKINVTPIDSRIALLAASIAIGLIRICCIICIYSRIICCNRIIICCNICIMCSYRIIICLNSSQIIRIVLRIQLRSFTSICF